MSVSGPGGYDSSAIGGSYPQDGPDTDMRPDDGWIAYLHHTDFAKVTGYVICAKGAFAKGLKYVRVDGNIGPGQGFQRADCPDGTQVLGGGASGSDIAIQMLLSTDSPADGGDPGSQRDDAWISRADPDSGVAPLEVDAICHK